MKSFLIGMFLLLIASSAKAVPSYVQGSNFGPAGSTTTASVTLGSAVGSGHTLMVTICGVVLSTDTVTYTDDKSNSYTAVFGFSQMFNAAGAYGCANSYILNVTNGPSTITATLNNARTFVHIIVDEYSGIATSAAVDGTPSFGTQTLNSTDNGTDFVTSGTTTTTVNGDLIYGFAVSIGGEPFNNGTGFTARQSASTTFYTQDLIQGAAGARASTFTYPPAGTGDPTVTYVVAFEAVGAPPGGLPHNQLLTGF